MKKLALFAPTLVLCAACSGSAVSLQPGQWETTIQFSSIEVPGAPEAMIAPMRTMMAQPQTSSACMTPEEAANPGNRMMNPNGDNSGCQMSENTFAGGVIKIHATCQTPRGTMTMNMDGSYTATTMQARINQQIQAPPGTAGPQSVRLAGNLSGRRTGECTSAPAAPAAPAGGNSTG
jgi:cytochrome c1